MFKYRKLYKEYRSLFEEEADSHATTLSILGERNKEIEELKHAIAGLEAERDEYEDEAAMWQCIAEEYKSDLQELIDRYEHRHTTPFLTDEEIKKGY